MKGRFIAREGYPFVFVMLLLTIVGLTLHWTVSLIPALALIFMLWFFRDPERVLPGEVRQDPRTVVAPADGRVMFVREVEEPRFIKGRAVMVSIFLSVFDVHINRAPIAGKVTYRDYVRGRFLAAWDESVGEVNERSYIGIQGRRFRVLVSQVAGLVARRIVTWPQVGDTLELGERFGLIRFGSCTQVWLPIGSEVLVKPGDRVQGGRTVLGRLPM